jgi:hypothetical protein
LIAFPGARNYNIIIEQNGTKKLNLDGENFLLINNDKIITKCSVAEELKKEVGQGGTTGHFIERPARKLLDGSRLQYLAV